jgi:DNA-binding transcriptional LysR family regulator
MRYAVAVAEELNVTRAAQRLGIGQPPLSQQIHDLEEDLGVRLFRRIPRGVELTVAGRAFLPEARAALAAADRARNATREAGAGEAGTLAIGLTGSGVFNEVVSLAIREFRDRYPGVLLTLDEMNTTRLFESLDWQELAAVFIRPGPANAPARPGLEMYRLPDEPMLVALPVRHRLVERKRLRLEELSDEPMILFPPAFAIGLYDELITACARAGFVPRQTQTAPHASAVINLVAVGLGISIVPASVARIQMEGVTYRPLTGDAPIARLALAWRAGAMSPMVANKWSLLAAARNRPRK